MRSSAAVSARAVTLLGLLGLDLPGGGSDTVKTHIYSEAEGEWRGGGSEGKGKGKAKGKRKSGDRSPR